MFHPESLPPTLSGRGRLLCTLLPQMMPPPERQLSWGKLRPHLCSEQDVGKDPSKGEKCCRGSRPDSALASIGLGQSPQNSGAAICDMLHCTPLQ